MGNRNVYYNYNATVEDKELLLQCVCGVVTKDGVGVALCGRPQDQKTYREYFEVTSLQKS
jgi:hypothetical protein